MAFCSPLGYDFHYTDSRCKPIFLDAAIHMTLPVIKIPPIISTLGLINSKHDFSAPLKASRRNRNISPVLNRENQFQTVFNIFFFGISRYPFIIPKLLHKLMQIPERLYTENSVLISAARSSTVRSKRCHFRISVFHYAFCNCNF